MDALSIMQEGYVSILAMIDVNVATYTTRVPMWYYDHCGYKPAQPARGQMWTRLCQNYSSEYYHSHMVGYMQAQVEAYHKGSYV